MSSNKNKNQKPLDYYLGLNYPITLYPEEAGGFTVEVKDLPGCLSQGETVEEACEMIAEARELWIEVAYDYGDPIPLPSTEIEYSGKTMLRMPTYLHQRLAENAKREGTSLNQYLVSLLSERDSLRVIQSVKDQLAELKAYITRQTSTSENEISKRELSEKKHSPTPYLVGEGDVAYNTSEQKSQRK